ncbi:hypothetical protein D9623_32395 [Azospirillum brasilense]|uniref:Uncharacterized protein n=1 Tax=Azospirillum brasilense TaxID=192 RepID=A0A0P0EIG2_AZOBR|nr:hypothetical protein [Azospirillum brasilense]PWC85007.1 hypothetical protein AEJ54_28995 [Azospirillum sp. Sp 7]ALJ38853.1 hypothetical protein AMK58_25465 [Azospirillum brasilense]NUB11800.1 hypothetical protein [Azospirillum brasilense]OPH14778.1 hypothetical protein FE89_14510 [Azospirillum brasilense]OPH19813.1 hypothetical protein FE88_17670 [Azospirillum brasilense]
MAQIICTSSGRRFVRLAALFGDGNHPINHAQRTIIILSMTRCIRAHNKDAKPLPALSACTF